MGPCPTSPSCLLWTILQRPMENFPQFDCILFSEILERCAPFLFVSVFIFTNIVSQGTSLHNVFHLDKFDPVPQNSSQIVFSSSVTFRIYSQTSFSLHPAGRFQLQFVSLRSTTISP